MDMCDNLMREGLTAFFTEHGLGKYAESVLVKTDAAKNHIPPEMLWANIVPTLAVLDRVASEFEGEIKILAAYRSANFNDGQNGHALSQHVAFRAIDFTHDKGRRLPEIATFLRSLRGELIPLASPNPLPRGNDVAIGSTSIPSAPLKEKMKSEVPHFVFRGAVGLHTRCIHIDTRGTDLDW